MLSITEQAAIRAATIEISAIAPYFAARFSSARNLLLRGGWRHDAHALHLPGGITTEGQTCTCQEGQGPIVCVHQIAHRILRLADRPQGCGWPSRGWLVVGRVTDATLRRCPAAAAEAAS